MPRRASTPPHRPSTTSTDDADAEDAIAAAHRNIEKLIGAPLVQKPAKKNPHAQALSKLGASKGGLARAASLTKKRRAEIAALAAQKRWSKNRSGRNKRG